MKLLKTNNIEIVQIVGHTLILLYPASSGQNLSSTLTSSCFRKLFL